MTSHRGVRLEEAGCGCAIAEVPVRSALILLSSFLPVSHRGFSGSGTTYLSLIAVTHCCGSLVPRLVSTTDWDHGTTHGPRYYLRCVREEGKGSSPLIPCQSYRRFLLRPRLVSTTDWDHGTRQPLTVLPTVIESGATGEGLQERRYYGESMHNARSGRGHESVGKRCSDSMIQAGCKQER
ncbi:Inosine-5'-monophosphate dehydrogenase 2 [Branchiostoma belcheri]|nr:Inosine-5'-monophosphate dehydrogenase 2 [Branchiostoma belcheri]